MRTVKKLVAVAPPGGSGAFTLVEVVVAAGIGAIIMAALFYGISQGYNIIQVNREGLRATQIVVGRIERIRLLSWGSVTNSQLFNTSYCPTTFTEYFYPVNLAGYFPGTNIVYNGTVTIQTNNIQFYDSNGNTTTSPTYGAGLALVTVGVTWSDVHYGLTNTFSRSMSTYVAQYGEQNYIEKF